MALHNASRAAQLVWTRYILTTTNVRAGLRNRFDMHAPVAKTSTNTNTCVRAKLRNQMNIYTSMAKRSTKCKRASKATQAVKTQDHVNNLCASKAAQPNGHPHNHDEDLNKVQECEQSCAMCTQ